MQGTESKISYIVCVGEKKKKRYALSSFTALFASWLLFIYQGDRPWRISNFISFSLWGPILKIWQWIRRKNVRFICMQRLIGKFRVQKKIFDPGDFFLFFRIMWGCSWNHFICRGVYRCIAEITSNVLLTTSFLNMGANKTWLVHSEYLTGSQRMIWKLW